MPYFRKAAILSEIGWSTNEDNEKRCQDQMNAMRELENELDRRSDSVSPSSHQSATDLKSIPLYGAFVRRLYLTRLVTFPGVMSKSGSNFSPGGDSEAITNDSFSDSVSSQQEVIVIQSPNLSKACILRFDSDVKCTSWFCAIQKAINKLNQPTIEFVNERQIRTCFDDAEIVYMSWFLQKKDTSNPLNEVTLFGLYIFAILLQNSIYTFPVRRCF